MAGEVGLKPTTFRFKAGCNCQLCYSPIFLSGKFFLYNRVETQLPINHPMSRAPIMIRPTMANGGLSSLSSSKSSNIIERLLLFRGLMPHKLQSSGGSGCRVGGMGVSLGSL